MKIIRPLLLGALAALGALFLELLFSNSYYLFFHQEIDGSYYNRLTIFLVLAAIIEETVKYFAISKETKKASDPKEAVRIALLIGAGFSLTESALALFGSSAIQSASLGYLPGIIWIHILTAGYIGYLIASRPQKIASFVKIILVVATLHLAYNGLVIYVSGFFGAYLPLLFLTIFLFAKLKALDYNKVA